MPTHLADLVQCLGQELLVNAAEVGHLLLALVVHVHATVCGKRKQAVRASAQAAIKLWEN